MPKILQYMGQGVFYAVTALAVGYFSINPPYKQVADNLALIKFSFSHGAQRVEDCRRLSPKEIAALPPLERRPNTCSRERNPVYVEFAIDGKLIYSEHLQPSGVSRDGPARVYRKFLVPAGSHVVIARLRDTKRDSGFDYETQKDVALKPGQSLAVDFRIESNGFVLR
ncbi:MAG: hypothetical protein U1E97_08180 [Alphaproteobacteria bacterium]